MRLSTYPINTLRDVPADAEVVSHQLMLRAGLIRRLASGLYTWLPMGVRVLRKVEAIVREEMDRAGAIELVMPIVQPAELWQESGRWEQFGPELLRLRDRHDRSFCLGPTHEEVITDIARRELKSHRQLPVNFYQIQTKFRDEIRPRFGVMRAREFVMKDAYSFHIDQASLEAGLPGDARRVYPHLRAHAASFPRRSRRPGQHRWQRTRRNSTCWQNRARTPSSSPMPTTTRPTSRWRRRSPPPKPRAAAAAVLAEVATPGVRTIAELTACLGVAADRCVKTLLVDGTAGDVIALVVRGDHELNAVKAQKLPGVLAPLRMASAERVREATGCEPGYLGPVGLPLKVYADRSAARLADFVCGANRRDLHLTGVNWGRDLPEPEVADLRNVVPGDPSPTGRGRLAIARGIEVGHIFQLGSKYSAAMNATVLDDGGRAVVMLMGCYGIGVTRVVAAAIEQNHDERGIIWPEPIAPFDMSLIPINLQKSARVREVADRLYAELRSAGFDVLYDDRDARPGVKFADDELLGIPRRVVVGDKGLERGVVEYRERRATESTEIPLAELTSRLLERAGRRD